MIQRIQSLYLFLSGILMLITLFFPLFTFQAEGVVYEMDAFRITAPVGAETSSTGGLFVVGIVSVLITLLTIFFYKKRGLQIKLTIFNTVLMLGFIAYAVFLAFDFDAQLNAQWRPGFVMAFPVISVILNWLAIKRIKADEALVKSLDRIR